MAGSSGNPLTLEVPGDNGMNLPSARSGSLSALTRSGATTPCAQSTAGGGGVSGATWVNARQVQESAIVAAVRRQMEALEEKLTLQFARDVATAQKHSDRLRDSGEARLDTKIGAIEQQQQRLERRLSEICGNLRSQSEELQNQMRRADQFDARAWGWRQKLEDDLRPQLLELEQNCQQANSAIRIAKAGSEEVLKAYNARISRIESLIDEHSAQSELNHSLMNMHNRLLQVEDLTPRLGRRGTQQTEREPSMLTAPAGSRDQAFVADLGKHWTDVLQLAESLRQESGDLRARVESQEESNRHLRAQWQAKDELIRGMRDRLERDNWESRFKELQARLLRVEQGQLLEAQQHHLGALMQKQHEFNGCESEKGRAAPQADVLSSAGMPPQPEWQTPLIPRIEEVGELQPELRAVREPPLSEKILWPDIHRHNAGGGHYSELTRSLRTDADFERHFLQPELARAADSAALSELTARKSFNTAESGGSGFTTAQEDVDAEELLRALATTPAATVLHSPQTEHVDNVAPHALPMEPLATAVHAVPTEPVAIVPPLPFGVLTQQEQPATGFAEATAIGAEDERRLSAEAVAATAECAAEEAAAEITGSKVGQPGSVGFIEAMQAMPVRGLAYAEQPEGSDGSSAILE